MNLPALTRMQATTLDALIAWWHKRREIPTRRELSIAIGLRTSTAANTHMRELHKKGYIRSERERSRATCILFTSKAKPFSMAAAPMIYPERCESCGRALFNVPCPRCGKHNTRKRKTTR